MDCQYYTTETDDRKKGKPLTLADRGAIKHLHKLGYSNRAIVKELNCSPATIGNELRRGTAPRKSKHGRATEYSANRGQSEYRKNKSCCCRPHKVKPCKRFVDWVSKQVREHKWSLDICV